MLDALDSNGVVTAPHSIQTPIGSMKRENRRAIRELAYYSSLGLQIALSIFIGLFLGIYLDRRFECAPWLTLTGLAMGIIAGYRNIGLAIKKSRKF
jgi:ATP synthase protein I